MSSSIAQNIEALCQEQGIERDLVIEAMKEAVRAAAKKQFRSGEDIQVDWNPETGIELSASKVVVDEVANAATELSIEEARELAGEEVELGDALLLPLPMEELGRIAAQTAKQILFQKVRDAVRSNVYEQYIDKIGDLVNGYVKRFERGNIIVDLGNLEAILPRSQQSRGEQWNQGERIRVVINNVSKESKGPQVEVSRTSPELLLRLFEMEVPEIYDGTVVIKSAVREPGERAKIAVTVKRARRRSGRRLRRYEGFARAGDHSRTARREDRHHRMVRRAFSVCRKRAFARQGQSGPHHRHRKSPDGSDRQRRSAFAGHRQARSERAPGDQTGRLEHRHSQRRRDQARSHRTDGCADRLRRIGAAFSDRRCDCRNRLMRSRNTASTTSTHWRKRRLTIWLSFST